MDRISVIVRNWMFGEVYKKMHENGSGKVDVNVIFGVDNYIHDRMRSDILITICIKIKSYIEEGGGV